MSRVRRKRHSHSYEAIRRIHEPGSPIMQAVMRKAISGSHVTRTRAGRRWAYYLAAGACAGMGVSLIMHPQPDGDAGLGSGNGSTSATGEARTLPVSVH